MTDESKAGSLHFLLPATEAAPPNPVRTVPRSDLVIPSDLAPGTAWLVEGVFVEGPEGWLGLFGLLELYRVPEPPGAAVGARFRLFADGLVALRPHGLGGVVRQVVLGDHANQIVLSICNEPEAPEQEDRRFVFDVRWPLGHSA